MKALVLYHDRCSDGACAGWAARTHLRDFGYEVDTIAMNPMQMPKGVVRVVGGVDIGSDKMLFGTTYYPVHERSVIFLVDVALPRADLDILNDLAPQGCWVLDHHKTNEEELRGYPRAIFDMNRSGAGLAWDEVPAVLGYARKERPRIVDHVEDRDLWRFKYPETKAIMEGCSLEVGFDLDKFDDANVDDLGHIGRGLLAMKDRDVASVCKQATFATLFGTPVVIVTSPLHQSEIGNVLATEHQRPAVVWSTSPEGVRVSVRSLDHLPAASDIAKALGGGGHRNAAGASLDFKKWVSLLTQ